jgi:glycosyltransferase involved in cell wall biosynthesis
MKPVLFVAGHAPSYRVGAFARLHEREDIEVALFGGRSTHGGAAFGGELPFPHRRVRPRELWALAASGRYRAICTPTAGRLAPAAGWGGARRAGVPLILWASLWAHPRTAAHAFSYLALRRLYRSADAVVTYGPHVSRYVRARGAHNVHVAPQSVDNDFWSAHATRPPDSPLWPAAAGTKFLFVGRPAREKGLGVLAAAWRASGLRPPDAALVLVGVRSSRRLSAGAGDGQGTDGIVSLGPVAPEELRDLYAAGDILVVPSIRTRTFLEPWGLVVNEAMNRGLAVIVSGDVGAAAGGLVRDGANGLVVPAGHSAALASAIQRLAADAALRARLGRAGEQDVRAYSHDAWAEGFSQALATLDLSRGGAGSVRRSK